MKLLTTTILLVVFMFSNLRLSAHNFVVWLTNGQRVYYSIDQQPRVIAENKMIVLQTLSHEHLFHPNETQSHQHGQHGFRK